LNRDPKGRITRPFPTTCDYQFQESDSPKVPEHEFAANRWSSLSLLEPPVTVTELRLVMPAVFNTDRQQADANARLPDKPH
jgi:hypothetical protein